MKRASLLPALLIMIASAQTAHSQPLAEHLPADSIVYVGWRGSEDLGPGYADSHLKALVEMSQLQKMISEVMPKAIAKWADQVPDPDAQKATDFLSTLGVALWKYPTAFSFFGVDMSGPMPMPQIALVCQAGKQIDELKDQIEALLQEGGPLPVPVTVQKIDQRLVVVVGTLSADQQAALGLVKTAKAVPRLIDNKQFQAALSKTIKNPVFVAYVDVERAMEVVDIAVVFQAEPAEEGKDLPEDVANWRQFRDLSGINGLKCAIVASGFDGRQWGGRLYLEAPAPRRGLLAMLDQSVISDELLSAIPESSSVAGAFGLDLAELVDMSKKIATQVDSESAVKIDTVLEQVTTQLDLDLMKDVLQPLGNQWASYVDANTTTSGSWGTVFVNRLRDAERFEKTLGKLEVAANALIKAKLKDQKITIRFRSTEIDGTKLHYLALPAFSPAWAIRDGNLYMALQPQFVASAAHHVASGGKSILTNPGFVSQRKQLAAQKFGSFTFVDVAKVAPDSYSLVTVLCRSFVGIADLAGVEETPAMILPPAYRLKPHLTPAVSFSMADDSGYSIRSIESFPGSTVLAIGTKGVVWAYLSSILPSAAMGGAMQVFELPVPPEEPEP